MTGKPLQILVSHRFGSRHHRMQASAAWRKKIGLRGDHQDPAKEEIKKSYVIKSIVSKTKTTLIDTKRYM